MRGRDGGDERFEKIFRRYYARVWRYYRSCRVTDDEAHDLAQDAFKRLFERMTSVRGEDEWPFLQAIARTVFLNWLRGRKTQKRDSGKLIEIDAPEFVEEPSAPGQPDYAEREQAALLQKALHDAVAALPDGQRQSVQLWLKELSYEEIAKTLRVSVDAVKSRIRDAKKTLSARLGDTLPEERE